MSTRFYRTHLPRPSRSPGRSKPGVERLERRVMPTVQYVDLGPLRFFGDFTQSGTQYTAEDAHISLGLKPASESFLPLLNFDLADDQAPGTLKFDRSDTTKFEFNNAAVQSVVGPKTLPLWQTAASDASFTTWSPTLLTSPLGQPVSGGQPYSALGVTFTLTALSLLNPGDGSTEDAEVAMQGSVGFPKLTDIDLSFVQASVSYPNYLRADTSGLHLDGLTATLAGPHAFTLYGMTANVSAVSVTYGRDAAGHDRFTFGFGATLQTQAQGQSGQRAFNGVAVSLTLTVTDATLTDVGGSLAGGFQIFGLSVATDVNTPPAFQFNFNAGRYEFSGGLTVTIPTATASTMDVRLGTQADPGLVVQGGQLTRLSAQVIANFRLAALQVTTPDGLTFAYDHEQFELYGDVKLTVPSTGGNPTVLTASLGTAAAPGLVVKDSELQTLNMSLSGQFDMFGMTVQVSAAGLVYDRAKDQYLISGTISIPDLWNATIALRGTQDQPGITIQDGQFQLKDVSFGLSNVNLGVFVVQQLKVSYSATTTADFDLSVRLYLVFPAGWGVVGSLTLVDHQIDAISLAYTAGSSQGIEVGDTGLFLTYLQGEVQNIDDAHNLLVSGAIAFTYGPQVTVYDPVTGGNVDVTAFAATGGFSVDRRHLQLDGDFYLAAYATGTNSQGEPQYRSIWGNSTATMDLDWSAHRYEIRGSFSWFDGAVQGTAALAFDQTGDLVLGGKVEFHVPDHIPFIGGKRIGSADGLFEFHKDDLDKSFLAAWVDFKIPVIDKHIAIGAKFDLRTHHASVIGGHTIDAFADCLTNPEQCLDVTGWYDYFNSFQPPIDSTTGLVIATEATLSVTWPFDIGTQTTTITVPTGAVVQQQIPTGTGTTVHVTSTNPDVPLPAGAYTLRLASTYEFDDSQVVFASVFRDPAPTVATPAPGPIPTDGTSRVTVTLTGTVDENLAGTAAVSLYVDRGNDPDHRGGVPVKGATALPITTDGQGHWTLTPTWDLAGLTPSDLYYLYAVINDGVSAPVLSGYSAATRVVPPLTGRVLDTALTPQTPPYPPVPGLLAYLDLNHDGQYDPSEPSSVTDASGLYSLWNVTPNTPYDVGLVIPTVVPPGATNPQAVFLLDPTDPDNTNPRRGLTYDGVTPAAADFSLFKLPSISGTVFTDLGQDGNPDPGDPGLAGWQVFLDANGNGRPDANEAAAYTASDGTYSFLALTPGRYRVSVQVPPPYYQTFPPLPLPYYDVLLDATPDNPYPQYPGANFGALPFVTVSGNVSQYTLQNGTLSPTTSPVAGQTVHLLATRAEPLLINAGGTAIDGYQGDQDFSLPGDTAQVIGAIDTHLVAAPAPQGVYQTSRYGPDFSYTAAGLVPGAPYLVTLHFAETYWTSPGQRVFDVALNGQPVLTNFDILNTAGGPFKALAPSFTATADGQGTVTIHFTRDTDNAQVNGIEVRPFQDGTVAINAGGGQYGNYQGDRGSSGGQNFFNSSAIDTSLVAGPAPQYVYQTFRYGSFFEYAITGLTPNAPHLVRLHFVEHYYTQAGQRLFDVQTNGQQVLTAFDIFGAAQARNRAVAESFTATADGSGTILVVFWGLGNEALVNAIEVGALVATTTTDAAGNYTFSGLPAGNYQVVQQLGTGTRQVAPFAPGLLLQPPAPGTLPPTILYAAGWPVSVAAANLDGTGTNDLVVLNSTGANGGAELQVFYNAGQGNVPTLDPFVPFPLQVLTGDFYGTGRQDILVLGHDGTIGYVQNQGAGHLWQGSPWYVYPFNGGYAYSMAKGQFASVDGVGPGRDQLAVLYQTGSGNRAQLWVDVLYVDASGALQRTTSAVPASALWQPGAMIAANITGDPLQNLLLGFAYSPPLLGYSVGPGQYQFQSLDFLPPGQTVVAGDIDGDGYDDPGVFDSQALFHFALADQAGNSQAYAPGVGVTSHPIGGVLLRDVNGDFRPDLVWVSEGVGTQALNVALNTGQDGGWFTPTQQSAWALAPGARGGLALDVADLYGDGLNDIVVADQSGGFVEIVANNSVIAPTPHVLTALASDLSGIDFVNVQLGQINGRAFDDVTRDGASLPGKPARAGVQVYVDLNHNGRPDRDEPISVTGPHGYFSFSGLPAGRYSVRWLDEPGRRPTSPESGLFTADLTDPTRLLTSLDFGNTVLRDPTLVLPADGSHDWTVGRNGDRLEIVDRLTGVVYSSPLNELHALTLVGTGPGANTVTVDLANGGFFRLPGGLHVQGGSGPSDTLRVLLGGGDNQAALGYGTADINAGAGLTWDGTESVDATSGDGRDRFTVQPQAARISIDAGPPTAPPGDRLTVLGLGHGARLTALGSGAGVWTFADAAPVSFRSVENLAPGDFVWTLYREVLGRDPDPEGHAYWREALDRGATRDRLVGNFWNSPEHRVLQVDALYRRHLHRAADPAGRAAWVKAMLAGMSEAAVATAFVTSDEYRQLHASDTAFVTGLYQDVLGRGPDPAGLAAWQAELAGGGSRAAAAAAFQGSPEARGILVDNFYLDYLVRAADPAGRAHWLDALTSGRATPAQVAAALLASDEFFATTL